MTARTVKTNCPICGKNIDAASNVYDDNLTPKEHDLSVCIYCGSFNFYNADLSLRAASDEEIAELDDDNRNEIIRMRRAIEMLNRRKNN